LHVSSKPFILCILGTVYVELQLDGRRFESRLE